MRKRESQVLRVAADDGDARDVGGLEPLAALVQGALDALGWSQADAVRVTGLGRQHVSDIVTRKAPLRGMPDRDTMERLAKIEGVSLIDIHRAVAASLGILVPAAEPASVEWSSLRRAAHNVIDDIPEDHLADVLHVLTGLTKAYRVKGQ